MQVSVETTGPLERQVKVNVPEARINEQVADRLKSLARTTRIDGFRPGKAPLRVVEQRFGERVRQEVVGELLRSSFRDAVVQERLRPAGDPMIDPLQSNPGQGLSYTATFEVFPEVSLATLEGMAVERPTCEIAPADVERMIDTLRRQQRTFDDVARPAQRGDRVVVDYKGYIDGEPFSGGEQADAPIELGAGRLIEGFEDGLVGASAGEHRTLDLKFPDAYPAEQLAGKAARFEVDVKAVAESRLPALDDAFFALYGVQAGGEEAFRAEVRRNMEREKQQALRSRMRSNLQQALHGVLQFEVPRALVASEAQRLLQGLRQRFSMQGASPDQLAGLQPEIVEGEARRRVMLGLVVAEVIKVNSLRADPAQVRAQVEMLAASYESPAEVVKWYYADPSRRADIEATLLEDQALDWILGRAAVTERSLQFDALMNPVQTANEGQGEGENGR